MIDPFSLALRGLAVGLVLALLLGSAGLARRARRALWPLLACLAAYLVRGEPLAAGWPPALLLPLSVAALLFPVAFWWLVHNVFDDRADLPVAVLPAMLLLLATGLLPPRLAADAPLLAWAPHVAQKLVGGGFVVAALWRLWRGRAGDLVPPRRMLRGVLLAYIGAHGLAVLGVELWLLGRRPLPWLDTLNVALIAAALAASLALLLGFRGAATQALFGSETGELSAARSDAPAIQREPPRRAADADQAAIDRLQRLMAVDRAYRDPGLAIATLAERCELPEYRLRELIHHRLGFRNFPAFVNAHRLHEVEQRLADPACDRTPILTLALDAGFGSIGPFNRAFRERHGMSPSEYRGRRGAASPAT